MPFPPGMVKDASQLRMGDAHGGQTRGPIALQSRVLSSWPDGSARWVLLDWQTDLRARQERSFWVEPGPPAAPVRGVLVTDHGERIEVDTGPLQFSVPKKRFAMIDDVRVDGHSVTGGPLVSFLNVDGERVQAETPVAANITAAGPLRARIELRGHYAAAFDYVIRIDAFAGQRFVRVLHTFEQHSPQAYTSVRQIGIDVPVKFDGKVVYSAGQERGAPLTGAVPPHGFSMFQEDNETVYVGGVRRRERIAGWIDVRDASHGIAVAARFFWQEYPQGFDLRPTRLTYNLWAPQAAPAKVGMGAAKTHEMVFAFHGTHPPAPAMLAALATPLAAALDPRWVVATGALRNSLAPTAANAGFLRQLHAAYDRYQAHAVTERWDDSGQVQCPDPAHERPRRGLFGMFNWGDWNYPGYHDTTKGCDAWGNLEYDMTQVLALAYATGEPAYYDGLVAAARHFMDVDRIHYQRDHPNWVGMNHPKNPLHFAFELGGVDLGHTWTEGLLSYYALTGDERGLESALGIADYLVRRLRAGVLRANPRQWGWPQIALIAVYEATGDAKYRDTAAQYARNGMAQHPPDKLGDFKMGVLAEGLAYTHSVTGNNAIRDWLVRYAAAVSAHGGTIMPRYLPALAYAGRLTGNEQYQRRARAAVAQLNFGDWGKPFTIAGRLGFSILSATSAAQTH
jgi:hypothetical protein